MRAIKNIMRRMSRSIITIFGIAIGVFLIVVIGALAERNNIVNSSDLEFKEQRITVTEKQYFTASGMGIPDRLLSVDVDNELQKVSGVKKVIPQMVLSLYPDEVIPFGTPKMILGGFMGSDMKDEWQFKKGQTFSENESGVAVVGSGLIKLLRAELGKRVELRKKSFEVVGILEPSFTGLDSSVFISMKDAKQLYMDSLPQAFKKTIEPKDIAIQFTVYPKPGQDTDTLAETINKKVRDVNATGPKGWSKQVSSLSAMIYVFGLVLGLIAFFAGGLLAMNAMMMSVFERTAEVGIERAMGASKWRIVKEFLIESLIIGCLGGLAGLVTGIVAVFVINNATEATGIVLFSVTWRLSVFAIVFSIALSVFAGIYPAIHASRLNPVEALAYE